MAGAVRRSSGPGLGWSAGRGIDRVVTWRDANRSSATCKIGSRRQKQHGRKTGDRHRPDALSGCRTNCSIPTGARRAGLSRRFRLAGRRGALVSGSPLALHQFEFADLRASARTFPRHGFSFDGRGLGWRSHSRLAAAIRARAAELAGVAAPQARTCAAIRYGIGAGLAAPRTAVFGDVIGISLLNPVPCDFAAQRREVGSTHVIARRAPLSAARRCASGLGT